MASASASLMVRRIDYGAVKVESNFHQFALSYDYDLSRSAYVMRTSIAAEESRKTVRYLNPHKSFKLRAAADAAEIFPIIDFNCDIGSKGLISSIGILSKVPLSS